MFIMMVVALALALTWIVPAGEFETVVNESRREVVVPGTYETPENAETLSPWARFTSVPRAMAALAMVVAMVAVWIRYN